MLILPISGVSPMYCTSGHFKCLTQCHKIWPISPQVTLSASLRESVLWFRTTYDKLPPPKQTAPYIKQTAHSQKKLKRKLFDYTYSIVSHANMSIGGWSALWIGPCVCAAAASKHMSNAKCQIGRRLSLFSAGGWSQGERRAAMLQLSGNQAYALTLCIKVSLKQI